MKMTIYVPDDLAEMLKDHDDLNVSGVCQQALREELASRAQLAELDKGMKRVVVYVEDPYEADVAFIGKELYWTTRGPETTAYLTRQHRIALYDNDAQALHQFDTFQEFKDEWEEHSPDIVAAVAEALGERHVVQLDI